MGKSLDPPAEPPVRPEELGQQLRQAREACRLSLPSAAASLHLPPRVIAALEENDFARFEPVYVRGYLRNYARLLNLAADPLIESYNRTLIPEHLPVQPEKEPPFAKKSSRSLYLPLAVVGLALVLWAASKAFQAFEASGTPAAVPAPSAEASPPARLPGPTTTLSEAKALERPASQPGAMQTEPAVQPPAPAAPAPQAAANPSAAAKAEPPSAPAAVPATPPSSAAQPKGLGPDSIAIRLAASGWVSIRDQAGRRLVYENLPAGTDRIYAGQAPFTVVLGNSPATQIEFNGQPFTQPKAKAGTVARFTLSK